MIQSNIQLEDIGCDSHEVHGLPEAQSAVSAVRANVPDVAGEVPETTDDLDDNWNDGEPVIREPRSTECQFGVRFGAAAIYI